jgi:ribosomal protein S27E
MPKEQDEKKRRRPRRGRQNSVQVVCPKCGHTEIIYIPEEDIPKCPQCRKQMVFGELLEEGKSY